MHAVWWTLALPGTNWRTPLEPSADTIRLASPQPSAASSSTPPTHCHFAILFGMDCCSYAVVVPETNMVSELCVNQNAC